MDDERRPQCKKEMKRSFSQRRGRAGRDELNSNECCEDIYVVICDVAGIKHIPMLCTENRNPATNFEYQRDAVDTIDINM
jgi:hypothetical protein